MKTLHLLFVIITIIFVVVIEEPDSVFAQIQTQSFTIQLSIPKFNFVDGEVIPISGHSFPNSDVNISLSDNLGNLENSTQVSSNNTGYFQTNLGIPSRVVGGGDWHILATSDNSFKALGIMVNTHGIDTMPSNFPSGLPPLKQFKLGMMTSMIQCYSGFQIMVKKENGQPACVKIESENKLFDRDWGIFPISLPYPKENNGTLSGDVVLGGGPASLVGPKANYEVDVYATDGVTIVGKTLTNTNAHYSIQLPAGNYIIYVSDYPTKQTHLVSVFSGKNTILNILYGSGYK